MDSIVMDWVKNKAVWFSEVIAVKKDVGHCLKRTAMWASGVIACHRTKGG
jgi:hypothetical protein